MGINIEMPWVLVLLLGNLFFLWLPKKLKRPSSVFYMTLRMLVYSLVVLSLAGISWLDTTEATHTIFLVDQSDSVAVIQDRVTAYINDQLDRREADDYAEIIVFGDNVAVEHMMTNGDINYDSHVMIDHGGTSLEKAYEFAINRFDPDKNKRLILISDFKETSGDLLPLLEDSNREKIEFKHYLLETAEKSDVQIVNVQAPTEVDQGESFPITVSVYANIESTATIVLMEEGNIVVQQEVHLKKGMQGYVFEDTLLKPGGHRYVASVDVLGDAYRQNNKWHHVVEVSGALSIVMIDPNDEGELYASLLMGQGIDITRITGNNARIPLEQLALYDGVVLINASIETLDRKFLEDLKLYVKELGGGLLAVGGDESYAVGGYEDTILEEILPVDMALEIDGESYDLAMMVVVDKSGSMSMSESGPTKMQMAKEAIIRVAETLSAKDQLGLVAFDGQPYEVLPLTEVASMDVITEKVSSVKADGGTSILPALDKGLKSLSKTALKGKHLLLVSDGQGEQNGFDFVIAQYPDVTISTIAIGENADARTMERIAHLGKGRFYQVTDYRKIPEIFTKETRLAMDAFIKEGTFVAEKNSRHPIVANVVEMPLLYGYIGTTPKDQAEMILSIEGEPLLSTWQYGLGRTMAWTSDVSNWSRLYYGEPRGVQLLTDLVSYIATLHDFSSMKLDVLSSNNTVSINGLLEDMEDVTFEVVNTEGEGSKFFVDRYSDGYFEGDKKFDAEGFFFLRAVDQVNQEVVYQSPIAVNYSKEYDTLHKQNILEAYVDKTGSLALDDHEAVFTEIPHKVKSQQNYDDALLLCAIILFVLDVACRKLRFDPIQRIMNKKRNQKEEDYREQSVPNKDVEAVMTAEKSSEVKIEKDGELLDTSRLLSKVRKRD